MERRLFPWMTVPMSLLKIARVALPRSGPLSQWGCMNYYGENRGVRTLLQRGQDDIEDGCLLPAAEVELGRERLVSRRERLDVDVP